MMMTKIIDISGFRRYFIQHFERQHPKIFRLILSILCMARENETRKTGWSVTVLRFQNTETLTVFCSRPPHGFAPFPTGHMDLFT